MIKFAEKFPEFQIVATLSQQLSWSHFVELIKIEDELKRGFYIRLCSEAHWPVRTLRERMDSMLYERTALSKQADEVIARELAAPATPRFFLVVRGVMHGLAIKRKKPPWIQPHSSVSCLPSLWFCQP